MALTVTVVSEGATASSDPWTKSSLTFAAGDLIIVAAQSGANSASFVGISDNSGSGSWASLGADNTTTVQAAQWWYKVANGSETSISVDIDSSRAGELIIAKVTGQSGTLTLQDSDEDETYASSAATTSFGSGSVTNTTAAAIAFMVAMADAPDTVNGSAAVSDGAAYTLASASSGDYQLSLWYHVKSATGTFSPVYSFTDTGDQVYGSSAIFGDVASGITITQSAAESLVLAEQAGTVSLSMPITQGASETLVLGELGGTVSLSIPIAQGSSEALVIAELGGTVTLNNDTTLTQGTAETLVLAELGGTVSLSMSIAQGSSEALVIAELGGTVTLNNDTTLTQGAAETLVLAELGGTVSLSMPIVQGAAEALVLDEPTGTVSLVSSAIDIVQGTSEALVITELGGTVTLGVVLESDSLAGLRAYAAIEMPVFFLDSRTRRRSSRPNWPALRAA